MVAVFPETNVYRVQVQVSAFLLAISGRTLRVRREPYSPRDPG